jgi:hypothetical protein
VPESHRQDMESVDRVGEASAVVELLAGVASAVALVVDCAEEGEGWVENMFRTTPSLSSVILAIFECLSA